MSYFQDWLSKSFKPCCNVLCSDKAKEIIAHNNLTPSEFLRPFGDFRGKKLQIQFNEKDKEPISLNDFILDFYDSENYAQIKQESILNYIKTMFHHNEPSWNLNYPLITKNRLEPVMNKLIQGQYCTPWFKEFEKTILECLNFDEYELYQQPLINVFIASIEEKASVINEQLVKKVPKIITDKRYDSSKESIIIILNDCKDKILKKEEIEKSKTRFAIFKTYYIFNWDINCPPFADKDEKEQKKISDNFKKYFHRLDIYNSSNDRYKDYMNKQYGKYINEEKYKKYREEFLYYFSNVFLQKMQETIINPLNDIIKKNTGFSTIFKKNAIQYYRNTNIYRFSELERSYYNLGILYFYFHNYESSNDNLKLLKKALKDKSDKHKDRVKDLKAMSKFFQKKNAKKEFNISEELKLNGNVYQTIRQELIIIKMLESKLKEENKTDNKGDMVEITKMINKFLKHNKKFESKEIIIKYFKALLEEKLAVYNLYEEKFRKYVFYMAFTGKRFQELEMYNYALYCLSKLLYFIDNPSPSFIRLRMYYNQVLGEVCNSLKYDEGSFKFYKNSFEFSCINFAIPSDKQNKFLQYYLSIYTQIKADKAVYNNIDLNDLNIPQVDNASLFVLENDDYDIKVLAEEIENSKEKNWLIFNKYIENVTTDVYASLDEIDLNHIKLIHDLTNETNKKITNVHTDRYFHGNINQKLFVKITIRNPLGIEIQVDAIKLFCSFIPNKKSLNKSNKKISSLKGNENKEKEVKENYNENKEKEIKGESEENKNNEDKTPGKENDIKEEIKKNNNEEVQDSKQEETKEIKENNKEEIKATENEKDKEENNQNIKEDIKEKEIGNETKERENKVNNIEITEKENNNDNTKISDTTETKEEIVNKEVKGDEKININNEILKEEKEGNLIMEQKDNDNDNETQEKEEEKNKEKTENNQETEKEDEKSDNEKNDNEIKNVEIENQNVEVDNTENKKMDININDENKIKEEEKNSEIKEISGNENKEEIKNIEDEKPEEKIEEKEKENIQNTIQNEKNEKMNVEKKDDNINKEGFDDIIIINKEKDELIITETTEKDKENENKTNNKENNENIGENEIKEENKENDNKTKENQDLDINDFEIINSEEKDEIMNEIKQEKIKLDEETIDETKTEEKKENEPQHEEKDNKEEAKDNKEMELKENTEKKDEDKEIKETIIKENNEDNIDDNKENNIKEIKKEEPKENIYINNNNLKDSNNLNTNNNTDNENKDTMKITRSSLEKNFKIDSHTESNQDEENNSKTIHSLSGTQKSGLILNPQNNENKSSSKSLLSKSETQNYQNFLTYSTCDTKLNPGETVELELNVSSSQEGKIIVKGLEFSLFSQCRIIHLFSKKVSPSLYYYTNKKKIFTMGGTSHISSSSSSDYESRNSSELVAKNLLLNNILIPRKNKIEYIVIDYDKDLFVSFPLGTTMEVFLYQIFFVPILIKNNSLQLRVRRYTIFVEDGDKSKLKTFINFITRDNKIKQRGSEDMIFIPIIPLSTGKLYLKILIKFISDIRQQPIQVKRFLIKLKVKESISFEVKEYCSNIKVDKEGKTHNKIDFNIKTNLRIRNEKEIKDLKSKEPLYNKDLNLINQKNYLINSYEIHKKYVFDKETNYSKNSANNDTEMKFNFDFIPKTINTYINKIDDNNTENNLFDTSYILNKFNKILNNSNSNTIFFPWEATYTKKEENEKNNEDKSDNKESESEISKEKEITIYGLYPYNLKMKNSETTKTFLSFLFNKFTDLKITTKKIDKEKTLIKMILKLDKIGLASMGDKIEKYEIIASPTPKPITWLGPKKYIVKNNLEETVFNCRFNFITTLKGNVEVNRISVQVYKKNDQPDKIVKKETKLEPYTIINLNHITKPNSIFIE